MKSKKGLHKKAWTIFSRHIRKKSSDWEGKTRCYTCGRLFNWKEMDAGHFKHNSHDFEDINIHPQCTQCNRFLHGNLAKYTIHLIKDYGLEAVKKFEKKAKWNDYSISQLENIIKKYADSA